MDSFEEVLKYVVDLYFKFLPHNTECIDFSNYKEEDLLELDMDNEDALTKTLEEIMYVGSEDYSKFSNIISLLSLHYYNLLYDNFGKITKELLEDEIINDMINKDSNEFIDSIFNQENDYLIDILSITLSDENMPPSNQYDYGVFDCAILNNYSRNLYIKYHPNIEKEMKNLKIYNNQERFFDKLDDLKINSFLEFLQIVMVGAVNIKDKPMLSNILLSKLYKISKNNKTLFNEIYNYMISNFYLTVSNQEQISDNDKKILEHIRNNKLEEIELDRYGYRLLDNFVYYNLMEYNSLFEKCSNEEKQMIKSIIKK